MGPTIGVTAGGAPLARVLCQRRLSQSLRNSESFLRNALTISVIVRMNAGPP